MACAPSSRDLPSVVGERADRASGRIGVERETPAEEVVGIEIA